MCLATSVENEMYQDLLPLLKERTESEETKIFFMSYVIYDLIHIEFKILEIVPSRLANLINKLLIYARLFIGFANLSGSVSYI